MSEQRYQSVLAAIATIRTLLNFFLARDLEKAAQRAAGTADA